MRTWVELINEQEQVLGYDLLVPNPYGQIQLSVRAHANPFPMTDHAEERISHAYCPRCPRRHGLFQAGDERVIEVIPATDARLWRACEACEQIMAVSGVLQPAVNELRAIKEDNGSYRIESSVYRDIIFCYARPKGGAFQYQFIDRGYTCLNATINHLMAPITAQLQRAAAFKKEVLTLLTGQPA